MAACDPGVAALRCMKYGESGLYMFIAISESASKHSHYCTAALPVVELARDPFFLPFLFRVVDIRARTHLSPAQCPPKFVACQEDATRGTLLAQGVVSARISTRPSLVSAAEVVALTFLPIF